MKDSISSLSIILKISFFYRKVDQLNYDFRIVKMLHCKEKVLININYVRFANLFSNFLILRALSVKMYQT